MIKTYLYVAFCLKELLKTKLKTIYLIKALGPFINTKCQNTKQLMNLVQDKLNLSAICIR